MGTTSEDNGSPGRRDQAQRDQAQRGQGQGDSALGALGARLRFPSWATRRPGQPQDSASASHGGSARNADTEEQWSWPGGIVRPGTDAHTLVMEMVLDGAHASVGSRRSRAHATSIADRLAAIDAGREPWLATRVASELLLAAMDSLYEHGWQPLDVVHVVRRAHAAPVLELAVATVTHQAVLANAEHRAPLPWVEQLREVEQSFPRLAGTMRRAAVHNPAGRPFLLMIDYPQVLHTDWQSVLALLGQWHDLPVWPVVCATPSQWPEQRIDTDASAPTVEPRVLNRVRGLLAKAEATTYQGEAEAFTAKAQELMTRYAIDAAILSATVDRTDVVTRRVHIENPYTKSKVHLLHEIALANRVRVVWDAEYSVATAVGTPVDLRQVGLLYESTLVQATRSMTAIGESSKDPATRSASFRRAFLFAYAVRVGQRLQQVGEHTMAEEARRKRQDGQDLLPILAAQDAAVNDEFERLFPQTEKQTAAPMDARGWIAGKVAADQAVLAPAGASLEA
ncbi:DUF2786 domain-containing protein [Lolliginicoccus suaedae]|uniref:DUF2786 domain-containing protein n=1 Tax=Lolliginicoccus suaedae TaxID=2605429 RepID=UPI0011EC91D1|nr:DUF2786 domain-containing protein [Lolliginicoccus suaedae]